VRFAPSTAARTAEEAFERLYNDLKTIIRIGCKELDSKEIYNRSGV
jgi:hypothetical protein